MLRKKHTKKNKNAKNKAYPSYYITHFNGGRMMYIECSHSSLKCYKILYPYDIQNQNIPKTKLRKIIDYTDDEKKEQLYTYKKPQYTIHNYKTIFVGHDTDWKNKYIANPLFGYGNTLLVIDIYNKVYLLQDKVLLLNNIRGNIQGYISPIGNNDCPYPIIFTDHFLYDYCGDIFEYAISKDKDTQIAIHELCKIKHPHHSIRHKRKIKTFLEKYVCAEEGKRYPNMITVLYNTDT